MLRLADPNYSPTVNTVEEVVYPGTNTKFKIRTVDIRSRLCHTLIANTDALNTVPCLPADQVRDFTEHIRFNDEDLEWNIAVGAGKEIPWPGYTENRGRNLADISTELEDDVSSVAYLAGVAMALCTSLMTAARFTDMAFTSRKLSQKYYSNSK